MNFLALLWLLISFTFATNPKAHFETLVWNVQKKHTKEWQKEFFRFSDSCDFILLQEATEHPRFLETITKTDHPYIYHKNWNYPFEFFPNKSTGLLNLSPVKPFKHLTFKSFGTEPITGTSKVISAEWFELEDSTLLILNVHALNFVSLETYKSQFSEVNTILKEHTGPVLFAGDFNTWNKDRKQFLDQFLKEHKIKEVPFKRLPSVFDLDHVYMRSLKVHAIQELKSLSSDHHAIKVEWSL